MQDDRRDHHDIGMADEHGLPFGDARRARTVAAGSGPDFSAGTTTTRASNAGFSLVELMLAIVLTVTGFVVIMEGCTRVHVLQRLDDELGHAYRTCRTNLDEMRTLRL